MNEATRIKSGSTERIGPEATRSFVVLFANLGGNIGDLYILDRTIQWLQSQFRGCRIMISPQSHPHTHSSWQGLVERYQSIEFLPPLGTLPPGIPENWVSEKKRTRLWHRVSTPILHQWLKVIARRSPFAARFAQADAVFGIGGGHWGGFVKPMKMLALLGVASEVCDEVILLPQSLPDSVCPGIRKLMPRVLSKVRLIYVRDPESLRKAQHIGIPHLKLVPDTVFLAGPQLNGERTCGTPPVVALALRSNPAWLPLDARNRFDSVIKRLRHNGCILKSFTTHASKDISISELMASIDGIEAVPLSSIPDLVQATSDCDVIISDRLHILIAATLVGTPIIPILSHPKLRGYVEYLSYPVALPAFTELSWERHLEPILQHWNTYHRTLVEFATNAKGVLEASLLADAAEIRAETKARLGGNAASVAGSLAISE